MPDAHANFAYSLVTVAPVPAASGLSLTVANGAVFPAVPFNAVVCPVGVLPLAANAEIVRVTGNAAGVLTILRQQESTSARAILVGDALFAAVTKKTLTDAEAIPNPITTTVTIDPADALDSSALVLQGSSSPDINPFVPSPTGWVGKEHIMRVYNAAGDLVWDIDSNGINDMTGFTVQDPPDQGGTSADSNLVVTPNFWRFSAGSAQTADPLIMKTHDGSIYHQRLQVTHSSGVLYLSGMSGNDIPLTIIQLAAPAGDLFDVWDNAFNNVLFRLDKDARPVVAVHTAPASGDLANGECSMWFDDNPAATKVMFKAKDSAGNVKTGSVTLT